VESDLNDELEDYLAHERQRLITSGLSPEDAHRAALRAFGSPALVREDVRATWNWNWLDSIWNDIRYALRGFRSAPLFAPVAVVTLAFGIGANTAIFSLLDQLLLQMLPVQHPEQLVLVAMRGKQYGQTSWGADHISYPIYEAFRDRNQVFSGMFCRYPLAVDFAAANRTERVNAELVSGSYFPVLGVGAALGRTLTPADDRVPGGHPVVMLSYGFWQTQFASDPSLIGKTIGINCHQFTVIGVAQRDFDGVELGYQPKLFIPTMMLGEVARYWDGLHNHFDSWVTAFGRLKPGISARQANAAMQPLLHSILEHEVAEPWFRDYSAYDRRLYLRNVMDIEPASHGWSSLRKQMQTPLWVLMGLTGAVLLLACANVANLLLARAAARTREMAVRAAIGAGRARIVRQLLVESLLLSGLSAAIGMALAFTADRFLLALYFPGEVAGELAISANPDLRVLAFTVGVTLFTAILFGLAPAIQSSRADLAIDLKDRAGIGGAHVFVRKLLVAAQIALSLLLLMGAGLFLRSLANLRGMGPGISTDRLLSFSLDPSLGGYNDNASFAFYRRLTDDLQAMPGVSSAGAATVGILQNAQWKDGVSVEGYAATPGQIPESNFNQVSAGYLAMLGVPLLAGRGLAPRDAGKSICVINETFARKYFAGRNPIGMHIGFGTNSPTRDEVVGIVRDIKYRNLRDETPAQVFYLYLAATHIRGMTFYVRSALPPDRIVAEVRDAVRRIDPNIPIFDVRTVDQEIDRTLNTERLVASLSTLFGGLATLLALVGLYGVMAYMVARRTREIGIRMALGALRGDVVRMVMGEVLLLIVVGVTVGVSLSLALGRLVGSQLYGLDAHDPMTLIAAATGLSLSAGLAGFLPALRASRVDPTNALRQE
jgi:putative ABC transport system permease protein